MLKSIIFVIYTILCHIVLVLYGKPLRLLVICDEYLYHICHHEINMVGKTEVKTFQNSVLMKETITSTSDFVSNLRNFNVSSDYWNIFLVFGDATTSNAAATVAKTYNIPTFLYNTSPWKDIKSSGVISLHGDPWTLGQSTAAIVERHFLPKTCFIVDYHHLNDQYLDGFFNATNFFNFNDTQFIIYKQEEDTSILSLKLSQIKENGYRVIIAHIPSYKIKRVFDLCLDQGYFEPGFAWVLSELSMPASEAEETFYPSGLLGIQRKEIDGMGLLIQKSLYSVYGVIDNLTNTTFQSSFDFYESAISIITAGSSSKGLLFDENRRRANISYVVRNKEFQANTTKWKDIGYVGSEIFTLNTIYWPGYTIFGPVDNVRPTYRVVTRPAEPYVFINGPVYDHKSCYSSFPCCLVNQTEPRAKSAFIDKCYQNFSDAVYCCSGIAIELLDELSKDLNFHYIIYFENNTNYGKQVNGTMTGMVGDVISDVADMIVGAFSLTSLRSRFIAYTKPFSFSGYSLVMKKETNNPEMDAFLKPFDETVWLMVVLSAIGTGIATSLLEWNSPFGLNPWARKRAKNYTLGSGLTMVFSLWFGHTVSTKPPKGWPSKVLQNVWAAMAIFIVASYTANLAAYLAGIVNETREITGIQDEELSSKSMSLIESSAVANFLEKIETKLKRPTYVDSLEEGLQGLREGKFDIYIDDTPILEYKLAEIDSKCTIKFSGNEFGENFYAIGLSKKSIWLEEMLSTHILDYGESGALLTMSKKYISSRNCVEKMDSVEPYDLEQTGGLFIMLVCGLALSVFLLVLEHAAFKYLVPYLRKQATDSRWRSRRTLEFFNQRLYRTVMSETLVSPQQTAREMMRIMKDRQFAKMFQKNELKEQQKAVQRSHPKGLKFMNLTDILLRSQSEDKSTCNGDSAIYSSSSSGKLFNISEEEEANNRAVKFNVEPQETDDVFCSDSGDGSSVEEFPETGRRNNASSLPRNNSDTFLDKHLQVNHLWDQKLQSEISTEHTNLPSELENRKKKRLQLSLSDTSYITKKQDRMKKRSAKLVHSSETPQTITEEACQTPTQQPAAPESNSSSSGLKSKSYYSSSVRLKDNRVKSTIRRHALAQFKRHSTSVFDECAVEALSKEDLLVLWKRSEIELQTKLNKLQSQNNHLKCLLAIVESDGQDVTSRSNSSKKKPKLLCTKL